MPSLEPWELAMLRCDASQSERGSILWYSERLLKELRLCLHHSHIHADALFAAGWERLTLSTETVVAA